MARGSKGSQRKMEANPDCGGQSYVGYNRLFYGVHQLLCL